MNPCLERIMAAAGGALDEPAAQRILEIAHDNAERLRREKGRVSAADLRDAVLGHHDSLLGDAARTRAAAYDTALKVDREFRTQDALAAAGTGWVDTIHALVHGIYREGKGGLANSVYWGVKAVEDRFGSWLDGALARDKGATARLFEQDWRPGEGGPVRAILAMGRPSDAAVRLSDDALRFSVDRDKAKVADPGAHHIVDSNDKVEDGIRAYSNRNGAFIPEPGPKERHIRVWEDEHRLRIMGRDAWKALVLRTLDVHLPEGEEIGKFLDSKFHELTTGQRMGVFERPEGGEVRPRDVFNWMEQRWHTPKSGDALVEYNRLAGSGTVFDSMVSHVRSTARANGFADRLGRKPMVTFRRLRDRAVEKLNEDDTLSVAAREAGTQKLKNAENWGTWRALSGEMDIPAGDVWTFNGRVIATAEGLGSGFRALKQAKSIAGVALVSHALTAPATAVANLRQHGMPLTTALGRYASEMLRAYGTDRETASRIGGVGFRALLGHMGQPFAATDTAVGLLSRLGQKFHRWGGMEWYPDLTRRTLHAMLTGEMGMAADKGWADLHPKYRFGLSQHGITPETWDAIRSARVEVDGQPFVDPSRLSLAPDSAIDPLIAAERGRLRASVEAKLAGELVPEERERLLAREAAAVDRMRAKARDGVENAYRQFIAHEIGRTLPSPDDPVVKGFTRLGQTGSWTGEFFKTFMQGKGFGVGLARRTMASQWSGNTDHGSLAQNIVRNRLGNFGAYAGTMLLAGLLTHWLRDVTQGKTPSTFRKQDGSLDAGALAEVVANSGTFGMYADYLAGEAYGIDKGAWMESLGGPGIGEIGNWMQLTVHALEDLGKKKPSHKGKERQLFDLVWGDTPLPNLYYTRAAVDALILNHIRELLDPGFLARHERSLRKEKGQGSLASLIAGR